MPPPGLDDCTGTASADSVAIFCFRVSATVTPVTGAETRMFKGRHFDRSVILLCVRCYLAHNLSLRNLEEMMAGRGISVDHATVHRWAIRYSPELLKLAHEATQFRITPSMECAGR